MYGHFYDNNRGNQDWYHLCPHIQFHKVQDNPNFHRGDSDALRVLLETESEDVQRVYKMYTEHFSDTFFDPRSGNQLNTGESMFEHVKNSSVKAAYTQNYQYIHLASLSSVYLPTDLWVPSSKIIKPQYGRQFAVGIFKNWLDNKWETSIEAYHKKMDNLIEYKEGALPEDNTNTSSDKSFTFGNGESY